jgi:hypothetical protein
MANIMGNRYFWYGVIFGLLFALLFSRRVPGTPPPDSEPKSQPAPFLDADFREELSA